MTEKDDKKGFSSLSDLTSDIDDFTSDNVQPAPKEEQTEPQLTPSEKAVHDLIKLSEWPTLPSPWSSSDAGETWMWGDFFITFQKNPKTIQAVTSEKLGGAVEKQGLFYHYSATVFYKLACNPHGPSKRPILVVALEQTDMGMLDHLLGGATGKGSGKPNLGPMMIGLFKGESRLNLGEYKKERDPIIVRNEFFEIIKKQINLSGQPKKIGDLSDAYGHPETGLTNKVSSHKEKAQPKKEPPNKTQDDDGGKRVAIGIMSALMVVLFFIWLGSGDNNTSGSKAKAPQANSNYGDYSFTPPKKAPSTAPKPTLSQDRDTVRDVQQRLKNLGYDPGPVDGFLGGNTEKAVINFQRDSGLVQDGEIDIQLVSHLRNAKQKKQDIGKKKEDFDLKIDKPSVGTNNLLSTSEIRWCVREGIRIEAMRDVITSNSGVDVFNRIVSNYNSRCASYRYRPGTQKRAERDIEASRSQIVSKAIREARQFGSSLASSVSNKPSPKYTKEAQQILAALGYDPGPADGDYGRRTADAVKAFQKTQGQVEDGWVSAELLDMLRSEKLRKNKTKAKTQEKRQVDNNAFSSKVYFSGISDIDRAGIIDACKYKGSPVNVYRCQKEESEKLKRTGPGSDLSGLSYIDRTGIIDACKYKGSPANVYRCQREELEKLKRTGPGPDLSGLSSTDRAGIIDACKYKGSPANVYRCQGEELKKLKRTGPGPDLSGLSYIDRTGIIDACKYKGSPANVYRCQKEELNKLRISRY